MNIVKLGCRRGTLWFFNLPSAETLIFSLKFDQLDPFSQMTQKVCQNSAILTEKTQKFEPAGVSGSKTREHSDIKEPAPSEIKTWSACHRST